MESTLRRTWAEIDLDALAHNYETLRRRIGAGVKFLGVVKADAYGHGAVRVAQTLQELGFHKFRRAFHLHPPGSRVIHHRQTANYFSHVILRPSLSTNCTLMISPVSG